MVDCVFVACNFPLKRFSGHGSRHGEAIADARFNFSGFFVVVPRDQLQRGQLLSGVVEAVDLRKGVQPGLPALLPHDATRSPGCQGIVEAFVGSSEGLITAERDPGVVETLQIAHSVIGGRRHYPGVAAAAEHVAESTVVLEDKNWLCRESGDHRIPVDRVRQVDIEIRDDWPPLHGHVSLGREISLLDVLQLADESLLRSASLAGVPLDRTLVDHNGEGEAGMFFCFSHDQLCCLVNASVWAIPVDDHAVDTAPDHVRNLTVNLGCVRRAVADVHMVRLTEPQHEMSIDLCIRTGIKQRMHVDLTHIAGACIAIALTGKAVGGTGVVSRLYC